MNNALLLEVAMRYCMALPFPPMIIGERNLRLAALLPNVQRIWRGCHP